MLSGLKDDLCSALLEVEGCYSQIISEQREKIIQDLLLKININFSSVIFSALSHCSICLCRNGKVGMKSILETVMN